MICYEQENTHRPNFVRSRPRRQTHQAKFPCGNNQSIEFFYRTEELTISL